MNIYGHVGLSRNRNAEMSSVRFPFAKNYTG